MPKQSSRSARRQISRNMAHILHHHRRCFVWICSSSHWKRSNSLPLLPPLLTEQDSGIYKMSLLLTKSTMCSFLPLKTQIRLIKVHVFTVCMKKVSYHKMSPVMRKPAFCICKNKDADQIRGYREADQRLCFCYLDSTIPFLPKSENSKL